jgi:hypothetical protein
MLFSWVIILYFRSRYFLCLYRRLTIVLPKESMQVLLGMLADMGGAYNAGCQQEACQFHCNYIFAI